jgi:uncharacterized protein (TIGR03437 family)
MAGQGKPSISGIANAGSFASMSISPGSIVTIFGLNLGEQDNPGAFPATNFDGFSVSFNGVQSLLFAVLPSSGQVNAFVPTECKLFHPAK